MIEELIRIIVFGAVVGGIWALVSSGFSLIFGVARILNFAHGALFILSAYTAVYLMNIGFNELIAMIIGVILSSAIGVLIYKLISPIKNHEIMVVIVTLAIALLITQILLILFGEHGYSLPPIVHGVQRISGVVITNIRILSLVVALIVLILLEYFINRTKIGKMITATSENIESAMLVGINIERIYVLTFLISSALAGISGILYAQIFAVTPDVSLKALIYAFAIVILGGLGSLRGSIIASFIVGYILVITINFLGARWSEFVMLLTIIAILIVKPTGLFGVTHEK